jgi:putative cell wall-binding protein
VFCVALVACAMIAPAGLSTAAAVEPDPVVPPVVAMGEYPTEAYAPDAASLDPGLVDAIARDLGESGEEYLAQADAAADASYVVQNLTDEGHGIRGSHIEGTELTVYVDSGDQAAVAAVEASGATVAFGVPDDFTLDTSGAVPLADLYDGQGWGYIDASGRGSACSVGFVGKGGPSLNQFATAGHCFPPGSTISGQAFVLNQSNAGATPTPGASLGAPVASSFRFGNGSDSGLVTLQPGWTMKPQVLTWGGAKGPALSSAPVSVTDSRAAVVGGNLCKSGQRTGWSCGTILAVDYDVQVDGKVVNSIIATTCADQGDSGGAAISGTTAVGITSAGPNTAVVPCGTTDYFSSYFPMTSLAGKTSVNSAQPNWEPLVTVAAPVVTSPANGQLANQGGVLTGTLANPNATNRVRITISGDAAGTRTVSVASNGSWQVPLEGLSLGSHTYTARATWNTYSESATVTGSFIVIAPPTVDRIAGSDRYAVAVAISQRAFSGSADVVYVATGTNYPDALSAAPAAVKEGGPLLLTKPGELPDDVRAEIIRLQPQKIVVVGGPNSVSPLVYEELAELASASIHRVDGADRYAVSRELVRYAFDSATLAYVATGANFPDALSAGAAGGKSGSPVVLVNGAGSSAGAETIALLTEHLGVSSIRIAGGPASVSPSIETELEAAVDDVTRLSGADRFEASLSINRDAFPSAPVPTVYLATGLNFPDALAGAALAGMQGAPVYLVRQDCVPVGVLSDVAQLEATRVTLLGGTATLSPAVQSLKSCSG